MPCVCVSQTETVVIGSKWRSEQRPNICWHKIRIIASFCQVHQITNQVHDEWNHTGREKVLWTSGLHMTQNKMIILHKSLSKSRVGDYCRIGKALHRDLWFAHLSQHTRRHLVLNRQSATSAKWSTLEEVVSWRPLNHTVNDSCFTFWNGSAHLSSTVFLLLETSLKNHLLYILKLGFLH